MRRHRQAASSQALFNAAIQQADLTGQTFQEALLDVAAEPPHYVMHAQVPWVSWLTPIKRIRFFGLRRQLAESARTHSVSAQRWALEADDIMTKWEFGNDPPSKRERWVQRRARLRQQWKKQPPLWSASQLFFVLLSGRQGYRSTTTLRTASGLMVGAYMWVAAGVANSGCITCDDVLLIFLANMLAPIALCSFFLQPARNLSIR